MSQNGALVRTPVKDISVVGRNTQGVRLIRLEEGDQLSGLERIDGPMRGRRGRGGRRWRHPAARSASRSDPVKSAPKPRCAPYNFSPGPAVLPHRGLEQVRERAARLATAAACRSWKSATAARPSCEVAAEAEADLRELMAIPRNYKVLFMQGGASRAIRPGADESQPRRIRPPTTSTPGTGRRKAIAEARRYCKVHIAGDAGGEYMRVPPQSELQFSADAAYVHYTPNETISGVEFGYVPQPAACRSSRTCRRASCRGRSTCSKFGLIYAGAQKNIGPSGLTVVIVREDLIGRARAPRRPRCSITRQVADERLAAEYARRPLPGTWRAWCSNG